MPIQMSRGEEGRRKVRGLTEGLLLGLMSVEDFSPAFLDAHGLLNQGEDAEGRWAAVAACVAKWEQQRNMLVVDELRALCYRALQPLD